MSAGVFVIAFRMRAGKMVTTVKADAAHEQFFQDLVALMRRWDHLPAHEILAIAANMVGKIMAMQDQRKWTPAQIIELVSKNIEEGNAQAIAHVTQTKGNA